MTEQTQPTDAAWWIITAQAELDGVETDDSNNCLKAARGALEKALNEIAKRGTPVGAGEPAGRVVSANCQYATVEWLQQTSEVGGGDPDNSRSWPITGDAVYLTPQPTQAQAGAVPLTAGWCTHCGEGVTNFCRSKCGDRVCPIGLPRIKGADHA